MTVRDLIVSCERVAIVPLGLLDIATCPAERLALMDLCVMVAEAGGRAVPIPERKLVARWAVLGLGSTRIRSLIRRVQASQWVNIEAGPNTGGTKLMSMGSIPVHNPPADLTSQVPTRPATRPATREKAHVKRAIRFRNAPRNAPCNAPEPQDLSATHQIGPSTPDVSKGARATVGDGEPSQAQVGETASNAPNVGVEGALSGAEVIELASSRARVLTRISREEIYKNNNNTRTSETLLPSTTTRSVTSADANLIGDTLGIRMSAAAAKHLAGMGVGSVADLARLTPSQLRAVPGFGAKRVLQARDALRAMGLTVADEPPAEKPKTDPRARLVTDAWAEVHRATLGEDPVWGEWWRTSKVALTVAHAAKVRLDDPGEGMARVRAAFEGYLGDLQARHNWPHEATLQGFANPLRLAGRFAVRATPATFTDRLIESRAILDAMEPRPDARPFRPPARHERQMPLMDGGEPCFD